MSDPWLNPRTGPNDRRIGAKYGGNDSSHIATAHAPVPAPTGSAVVPPQFEIDVASVEIARNVGPVELYVVDSEGERRGDPHGLFKRPLPSSFSITTRGRVVLRPDGRRSGGIVNYRVLPQNRRVTHVYVEVARVSSAEVRGQARETVQVTEDGEFSQETHLIVDAIPHPPRTLTLAVNGRPTTGKIVTKKLRIELADLEGFATLIEEKERKQPDKTRKRFLASVRKLYQGRDAEALKKLVFNLLIGTHADVDPLATASTEELRRLLQYEVLYSEGIQIDLGHVLVGVEVTNHPEPKIPFSRPDIFLTWGGDLGSALQEYIKARFFSPGTLTGKLELETYLTDQYARREDLIGDIDGINLGAIYDGSLSTAANLRSYYGKQSRRRFHAFCANTKHDDGTPALPLEPNSKPPRLAGPARDFIAYHVSESARTLLLDVALWKDPSTGTMRIRPVPPAVKDMLEVSSQEVVWIRDHFCNFLERGLAAEVP